MTNYQIVVWFKGNLFEDQRRYNYLIENGAMNGFVFFEKIDLEVDSEILAKKTENTLLTQSSIDFYAKNEQVFVKVTILGGAKNCLIVIPQVPFFTKRERDLNGQVLDLAVYVEVALGFCDNFAISQLLTESISESGPKMK